MEGKKTILIVEDERASQKAMAEKFNREGFDVIQAFNGKEGLETANEKHPDLILLDIVMPKMDGITMFEKLRAESEWGSHVPVIVLTNLSFDDKNKKNKLGNLKPEAYIIKAESKLDDVVKMMKKTLGV